jgi:hypothetical protein
MPGSAGIVRDVTTACRLAIVVVIAGSMLTSAAHAGRGYTPRRFVFVAISGHGTVTSTPRGIACPRACRAIFRKDALVRLVARPAPGWSFGRWSGSCVSRRSVCAFNLTGSHDCSGSLCNVGAIGVRVAFVRQREGPAMVPSLISSYV